MGKKHALYAAYWEKKFLRKNLRVCLFEKFQGLPNLIYFSYSVELEKLAFSFRAVSDVVLSLRNDVFFHLAIKYVIEKIINLEKSFNNFYF